MTETAIDLRTLLFETQIAVSAVHAGVELLARRSTEPPIAAELSTLAKLTNQACEALETLQAAFGEGLNAEET